MTLCQVNFNYTTLTLTDGTTLTMMFLNSGRELSGKEKKYAVANQKFSDQPF